MRATAYNNFKSRVAKCHGYGGYFPEDKQARNLEDALEPKLRVTH